jgi:hypothetical protein
MSLKLESAFGKLPTLWKLSIIRCLFYCVVQAFNGIISGLDGYTSFSDISWFSVFKLSLAVSVDVLMTWIAFLDQSIKTVAPNTESVTTSIEGNTTKPLTPLESGVTLAQTDNKDK